MAIHVWLLSLSLAIICLQSGVYGEGHIEIQFVRYISDCGDCDPQFTFCVDRPSSQLSVNRNQCSYGVAGESGHYHNTGFINFGNSIKGITNPWKVRFGRLHEKQIMLVTRTRDDDIFGADHMETWGITLTETVYPTEAEAKYKNRKMEKDNHIIDFKIKIYCIEDYYGWNCGKKCPPPKAGTDHYVCDTSTGNKICDPGWKGKNCDEDVNECDRGVCERGKCENLPGKYHCHCPDYYSGQNCTILGDPCESEPCHNNGTCVPVSNEYNYTCSCEGPWEGQNCSVWRDPCASAPCLNGGECSSNESVSETNFTCTCKYPYTGFYCDGKEDEEVPLDPGTAGNTGKVVGKNSSGGFVWWHGFLICIIVIIALILIILFLLMRRRRKEKDCAPVGLPPGDTVLFNGNNLAFENNMYSNGNSRSHTNGAVRQQIPLPTTPSEDPNFNPLKAGSFFAVNNETQGAVGGYDPEEGAYMKPSGPLTNMEKELKIQDADSSTHRASRAQENPYSDFKAVRGTPLDSEPHYQDLDEVARAFHALEGESRDDIQLVRDESPLASPDRTARLSNLAGLSLQLGNQTYASSSASSTYSNGDGDSDLTSFKPVGLPPRTNGSKHKENLYSEPTAPTNNKEKKFTAATQGTLGLTPPVREGMYNDVPTNTPAVTTFPTSFLATDFNTYSPNDDNDDEDFDSVLAQRLSSRRQPASSINENQYAEPAIQEPPPLPPLPIKPPILDIPTFAHETYADMTPTTAHIDASKFIPEDNLEEDEDDIPNVGLPPIDVGYESPKASFIGNNSEPMYTDPKDSGYPTSIGSSLYDSPRSSSGHDNPPDVPLRPHTNQKNKPHGSTYEDLEQQTFSPPVPSKPVPLQSQQSGNDSGFPDSPEIDLPRPLSIHHGFTDYNDMERDETNVDNDYKKPALFMENQVFYKA